MGFAPTVYALQLIYYILCNIIFVLGLVYLTAAINVFLRDLTQIISIFVLQIGVWLTPIMWDAENKLGPKLLMVFRLNPMFYIVNGFRDSMLYKRWFWEGSGLWWTLYFWVVTLFMFWFGVRIFNKLREYFADVL